MKLAILLLILMTSLFATTKALSCYLGDFGCYTSCEFQNCATGHCTSYGGTCICSRCANGGIVRVNLNANANIGVRKRRQSATENSTLVSVQENIGRLQLCLTGDGNLGNNTVVVDVRTQSGSATEYEDYYPIANTYLFINDTHKTDVCFDVIMIDDNIEEKTENFTVLLNTPVRESTEPQLATLNTKSVQIMIANNGVALTFSVTMVIFAALLMTLII